MGNGSAAVAGLAGIGFQSNHELHENVIGVLDKWMADFKQIALIAHPQWLEKLGL